MVVYVLRSESTGRYYTGCTEDLENRLHEHNAGYMRILGLPQKQKKAAEQSAAFSVVGGDHFELRTNTPFQLASGGLSWYNRIRST